TGWSRGSGPTKPGGYSEANLNAARASWRWTLDVSVAPGAPCLRRSGVRRTAPVLLFPAEDSLAVVRRRLEGICSAAGVDFQSLPVEVITAPTLRLDAPKDRERLSNTVQARQ